MGTDCGEFKLVGFMVMEYKVKKVIYNDPATIVMWNDGTKTVVRCQDGDVYDPKVGLLLCFAKKLFGNTGKYNNVIKEWSVLK